MNARPRLVSFFILFLALSIYTLQHTHGVEACDDGGKIKSS
jgi:hypothetical protein